MDGERRPDLKPTFCALCSNLPGCSYLHKRGRFLSEQVITPENPHICDKFSGCGDSELGVRKRLFDVAEEMVAIEALFSRGTASIEDPRTEEEAVEDVPDFRGMLFEGITIEQRDEQLRYQTDEEGQIVVDEVCGRIPRGSFALRKYALGPDTPIDDVPGDVLRFWKTDQLVQALLKAEFDKGLLVRGGKQPKTTKAAKKAEVAEKETEREDMAEQRKKVIITRKSKPSEDDEEDGGKKILPKKGPATAKKTVTKKAPVKAKAAKDDEEEAPAERKTVAKTVAKMVGGGADLSALKKELAEVREYLDGRLSLGLTLLHDVLVQKINEIGKATAFGLAEINEDASTPFWETVPLKSGKDGDVPNPSGQSILGQGGKSSSIFDYLEGAVEDEEEEEEESGEDEEEEEEEEEEESDD